MLTTSRSAVKNLEAFLAPGSLPLHCLCPGLTLADSPTKWFFEKERGPDVNGWKISFRLGRGVPLPCYLGGGGGHTERQPQEEVYQSSAALSSKPAYLMPRTLWCDGSAFGFLRGPHLQWPTEPQNSYQFALWLWLNRIQGYLTVSLESFNICVC